MKCVAMQHELLDELMTWTKLKALARETPKPWTFSFREPEEEEEEEDDEFAIPRDVRNAIEGIVVHLEQVRWRAVQRLFLAELRRTAMKEAARRVNPDVCATILQRHWRGHRVRRWRRRELEGARLRAEDDARHAEHGGLGDAIAVLEQSSWEAVRVIPLAPGEQGRKTEQQLLVQRFAAKFRRNIVRECSNGRLGL